MGRPRRFFEPDKVYLIRNICTEGRARLRPSPELNEYITALVTKLANDYNIELIALNFLLADFELLVMSPDLTIQHFMCQLQSLLSKKLNALHGRTGPVFGVRFTAEVVLEDAQEEVLRSMITRSTIKNLVAHPEKWPGVSTWKASQTNWTLTGHWFDAARYLKLKQQARRDDEKVSDAELRKKAHVQYDVKLTKLPVWAGLSEKECAQKITDWAAAAAEERRASVEATRQIFGDFDPPCAEDALDTPPNQITDYWEPLRRTLCLTFDQEQYLEFCQETRARNDRYIEAARLLRRGEEDAYFPGGMIPPGFQHCIGSPAALELGENPQEPAEWAKKDSCEEITDEPYQKSGTD